MRIHLDILIGRLGTQNSVRVRVRLLTLSLIAIITFSASASAGVMRVFQGDWEVTATSTPSHYSRNVGQTLTGSGTISYKARFLGLPLPLRAYYTNSFPNTFNRPSLKSWTNANLPTSYSRQYNSYLSVNQWEIRGSGWFAGEKTVKIVGDAKAATKGLGYFYMGTANCPRPCATADAVDRITVK